MKINVYGDHYVIESSFSLEQIKKVAAHRPNALKLRREPEAGHEPETIFQLATAANGGLNSIAMTFARDSATTGKAILSQPLPPHESGRLRQAVVETVGVRIAHADAIEAQIRTALQEIAADEARVNTYIFVEGEN